MENTETKANYGVSKKQEITKGQELVPKQEIAKEQELISKQEFAQKYETTKKLNKILVALFHSVLKMEEKALQGASDNNLSLTEVHTLDAIGIEKAKTMSQAASDLKISVGTLTVAINRLVKKGHVERFRVEEDRRIVKIKLTDAGIKAVREHERFHLNMVGEAVSSLDEAQKDILVKSLDNIYEFFKMQNVKPIRNSEDIELKPLKLGTLTIPVPIIQGGMGIGVSMSGLASAAAKCGGIGVISAAQPGYLEEDFYSNSTEANARALKRNIRDALNALKDLPDKEHPKKGIIAVNIMVAAKNYEGLVRASVEAGVQMIISGAGLPTSLPAFCKDAKVKLVPIISSARAAAILIKSWAKKYDRVPDAILFEGPEAGGHLGFKEEHLETAKEDFYKTIREIKEELENIPDCPLIVGGGIFSKEDMKKAMSYGADGVQLGTRFVTTEECDAHQNFKEAYLRCKKEDIIIIKSPVGMPGRALRNQFTDRADREVIPPNRCNNCIITCKPGEAAYCITDALILGVKGDVDNGLVFCGSNAYKCEKMETVKEIFDDLCS